MNSPRAAVLQQGIAARLRALQSELELTDRGMAARLGVGRSVWGAWVNARNMPNELAMIRLCEMAGVDMDWIYRGVWLPGPLWVEARRKGRRDAAIS